MAEVVKGPSKMTLRVTSCSSDYKKASVRNALRLDVSRTHFCCGQHKSARYGFFAGDGRFMRLTEAEKVKRGPKKQRRQNSLPGNSRRNELRYCCTYVQGWKKVCLLDLCQPVV